MAKYLPAFPTVEEHPDQSAELEDALAPSSTDSNQELTWLGIFESAGLVYSTDEAELLDRMLAQAKVNEAVSAEIDRAAKAMCNMDYVEMLRRLVISLKAPADDERRLRRTHIEHMRRFYRALENLRQMERKILSEMAL